MLAGSALLVLTPLAPSGARYLRFFVFAEVWASGPRVWFVRV
jgi:hypothetical protein